MTTSSAKMMGFEPPGSERVPVPVRDWNALKLALWRSKVAWEITAREAAEILKRCRHSDGCLGAHDETEPCPSSCPDREIRMSALVVLTAARQLMPVDARKAAEAPYFAPSREYFSEVLSSLVAAEAELEVLRDKHMSVHAAAEELVRSAPLPPQQVATRRLAAPTVFDFDPPDEETPDEDEEISEEESP